MRFFFAFASISVLGKVTSFSFPPVSRAGTTSTAVSRKVGLFLSETGSGWSGDVASSVGGAVRGCTLLAVGEEPIIEWIVHIDG
jgi:hypothetical protein